MRQQGPRMALQGQDEHLLGRVRDIAIACTGSVIPLGEPQKPPVGRLVDRALVPGGIHEGLQEQQREPKPLPPVLLNPSPAEREHPGGQVLAVAVRQDEKAGIVGHQVQPVELVPNGPADPLVADGALPRSSGKTHQGHPVPLKAGDIPESVPNLRQGPKVVIGAHGVLKPRLLGGANRTNDNLVKAHHVSPVMDNITTFYQNHAGMSRM